MSRAVTAAGQLATSSRHIFMTKTTQADGTKKVVMSAQPLCDQSFRMNSAANGSSLFLLMGLCLQNNNVLTMDQSPLMRLVTRVLAYRKLPHNVWEEILGFSSGLSQHDSNPLASLGNYAVAIRRPSSLFQAIEMDPFVVVDAAMRGQEDMVLNILRADSSYLEKPATVKNSVDVEYIVKPLQAAIMANDVQMAQKIAELFANISNGDVIMQGQILQIYKKSLRMYYEKQVAEVTRLTVLKTAGTAINEAALTTATARRDAYEAALRSNNILDIVKAHDKAQEHNAFDFKPYVDAILDPTLPQAELDEVMELINATTPDATQAAIAKGVSPIEIGFIKDGRAYTREDVQAMLFSDLTLLQKINRFREKLTQHMQQEIIFNPHHILAGLKINGTTWDTLPHAQDPQYKKRSIIFSQLVGRAQGTAAEPVKQDIRQGTYYLIEENEPRSSRSARFNTWDHTASKIVCNSLVDDSLINSSSFDGLGYKFGAYAGGGPLRRQWQTGTTDGAELAVFSKLMSSKNIKLGELMQRATASPAKRRRCVIQ